MSTRSVLELLFAVGATGGLAAAGLWFWLFFGTFRAHFGRISRALDHLPLDARQDAAKHSLAALWRGMWLVMASAWMLTGSAFQRGFRVVEEVPSDDGNIVRIILAIVFYILGLGIFAALAVQCLGPWRSALVWGTVLLAGIALWIAGGNPS